MSKFVVIFVIFAIACSTCEETDNGDEFMSLVNVGNQLKKQERFIEASKSILPEIVKNLVWSNICLRDHFTLYDPYLYAAKEGNIFPSPDEDQRVLTNNANGTKPETGAEWKFEMTEDDNSFYIRNVFTEEYLFVTEEFFIECNKCRKMALSTLKYQVPEFKWKIVPYSIKPYYSIRNIKYFDGALNTACWRTSAREYCNGVLAQYSNEYPWTIEKC